MCGIAGIYQQNSKRVSLDLIEMMGNLTYHRGPDNFSFMKLGEQVGLSHNRLSFLDLSSAANQPFKNENYALVYNGEIYNFMEIRARLEKQYNVRFKTASDTEVLFQSLIHDGIHDCLTQLRGMFAFAFYDRVKNELWLGRDRLGIKPLYYYHSGEAFYWSSEIKSLAQTLNLKPDPIRTLFSINGTAETSNEYTLFNNVFPVKPGSYLKIGSDSEKPREFLYYEITDDFEPHLYRELDEKSRPEVFSEFEQLLVKSVENMLISDVPVGTFASGGLDSSLLSAIACRQNPDLKLFTANMIGKFSEFEDAKIVAKHLGTELFDYKFEPEMMLRDWADVTYFYECPIIIHTNAIPFSNVAQLVRDSKVKAVLTGEGADELFLGYPHLLAERYKRPALFPVNFIKSLYGIVPGLKQYLFPNPKQSSLEFTNQLVQQFERPYRENELRDKLRFLDKRNRHEQMLTIRMLGDHLVGLLHRNDRMGMMASIEARFPFLDEELVKFAVNLPSKYKVGRSLKFYNYKHPFLIDKWIVRKTAEKYLPKSIAMKKKMGFPMIGHKSVSVNKEFFKNGWVKETLSLNDAKINFMLENQNPYFVAKLASLEIFGQIYSLGEKLENVKNRIMRHMKVSQLLGFSGILQYAQELQCMI